MTKSFCSFALAALLLAAISTTTNAQTNEICTICANGVDMLEARANTPICKDLPYRTNGMFETDYDCLDLQLEAFQVGCCPTPPFNHCEYCADGSPHNPDAKVPNGQFVGGQSCFDYSYQNQALIGMFEDGKCEDTFLQRAGHYCGCPDQKQQCTLCPDGLEPGNPGKGDDWVTGSNCRGIEFLFSLFTEDECSSFPLDVGADLAIFCGCGGLNQEEIEAQKELFQCELCRNNGFVIDPDLVYTNKELSDGLAEGGFTKTCGQADEFAREIIKTPYGCNNNDYFGLAREVCCSNGNSGGAGLVASRLVLLLAGLLVVAFV
jgi:hypothetical protein